MEASRLTAGRFGLSKNLLLAAGVLVSCLSQAPAASLYTVTVDEGGFGVIPKTGNGTFTSSAPISATMLAGPTGGDITANAASGAGHVGASLKENESLGGNGNATATFSTDVTISGPAASTIPVALNVNIAGILGIGGLSAQTQWTATVEIAHTDFTYTTSIVTGAAPTQTPLGLSFTSGGEKFSPLSDFVSGVLTTGFVNVDPSVQLHIAISLQLLGFGNPGSVDDDFLNSLDFARGIDVLTLPQGYTANDPEAFLVNNRFLPPDVATPIPATLPLFASGLAALGLLGWRRKKKASLAV